MTFDKHSTAEEVLDGVDLTEKTIIVTGATSGIGIETARVLASRGANISLTARDMAKAKAIVEEIRKSTGNDNVNAAELDSEYHVQYSSICLNLAARSRKT